MESPNHLAALLGDLAIALQAEQGADATVKTIVEASTIIMPGISWAGISLVRGKTVTPEAPTDAVARSLDQLQSDLREGPALSALADDSTIAIPDLRRETRWPKFVAAAVDMGVQCLMSFRLFVDRGVLGALNLYGPQPNMFSDESIVIGEILAQHAAVALAGAIAEEQMQAAIASRDVIGQAKGILMHRDNLTGLQAFAVLTRASQETNIKLTEVARFFVDEFEKGLPGR